MNNWKKTYKVVRNKKRKQQLMGKTPKKISFKRKKHTLANFLTSMNGSVIIFFVCLMGMIIIIPTLIVFPYSDETVTAKDVTIKEESVEQADEETVSVAVLRTDSDEIENIPLETYVARVVASEMPAEFATEALKAQSVAARTYVVNYLHLNQAEDSFISDQVEHQVYKNEQELREQWGEDYQWKMDKIKQAVNDTSGEILTYDDTLITPVYFSTSNGFTENSEEYWQNEIPYLRSVESPWDKQSPKFKKQFTFSFADIEAALDINLTHGINEPINVTKTTGQRVKDISINESSFTGREIREKLQLPSSDFTIEQKNNYLVFTTRGYGHGVGMSQYGANGMAEEGHSYADIIAHYYKDVTIDSIDQYTRVLAFNE